MDRLGSNNNNNYYYYNKEALTLGELLWKNIYLFWETLFWKKAAKSLHLIEEIKKIFKKWLCGFDQFIKCKKQQRNPTLNMM